ncbi:MAG: glutathione S-transferase family protein [Deltaproteobacteria bacterium]|nr:glutathione S-transferase family protein [Deltaproteobacteria bacterium]MBW2415759.1 glutathione S-transferase family protein [Deltaproteobacteria bacterium]
MKLYFFPVAPNPTRVRLCIAEKAEAGTHIDLEEVMVNLPKGEQKSAEHQARNPLGRLPVLELDDGSFLTESLAIIEYLDELYPEPPLIGRDPLERARVREIERIAEMSVLRPIAIVIHATESPLGLPPVPEVAASFRQGLPESLAVLDERLADGRPFLAGDHPTIADCTLAAALQFGRFRKIEPDPALEHLARWNTAYRERPAAKAVLVL